MYVIYCLRNDCARPVAAAESLNYEHAKDSEERIADKVRMAKSLGELGNKYLQKVHTIYISDGQNNTDYINFDDLLESLEE